MISIDTFQRLRQCGIGNRYICVKNPQYNVLKEEEEVNSSVIDEPGVPLIRNYLKTL